MGTVHNGNRASRQNNDTTRQHWELDKVESGIFDAKQALRDGVLEFCSFAAPMF
jgi:hypothetical protein